MQVVVKADSHIENMAMTATLIDAGLEMMRGNIRRRHVAASSTTVDAMLLAWMRREVDPIPGDTGGAWCAASIDGNECP